MSADLSLEMQRVGGRWLQTVTTGGRLRGGVATGCFVTGVASRCEPEIEGVENASIRNLLTEAIGDRDLVPVFTTEIKRTIRTLRLPGGEVEFALDRVKIHAGDQAAPFHELVLKSDEPVAAYEAAAEIFIAQRPPFSTISMRERGHLLLSGQDPCSPAKPVRSGRMRLETGMTTGTAMEEIIRHCLVQISANIDACLAGDDPAGPHQLRVGLRRLRSAFRGFRSVGLDTGFAALDDAARVIAAEVGALRDLDVAINEIFAGAIANEPGGQALGDALAARRAAVRVRLREFLAGPDVTRFPMALGAFKAAPGRRKQTRVLARPISRTAGKVLTRALDKVEKRGRHIEALTTEERHDLRKAVKKLRYMVDFFGPLYPKDAVTTYAKRLRKLQNRFGFLNDAAVAAELIGPDDLPTPAAAHAAGRAIGWREAMAEKEWPRTIEAWDLFRQLPPFWTPAA